MGLGFVGGEQNKGLGWRCMKACVYLELDIRKIKKKNSKWIKDKDM